MPLLVWKLLFKLQEEMERLSDVQNLVMQLYEALHVKEHHEKKQRQMLTQLENLQAQLLPLEEVKLVS